MYRRGYYALLLSVSILLMAGCGGPKKPGNTLFTLLPESHTGIGFSNNLEFDQKFNIYTYRNYYNGGGVAIGDVNNDGLPDIYFNANQTSNKLFLNKGNMQFEDITKKAGVSGTRAWSTGAAMADVNGDGWLDIYVCNSGDIAGDKKENELFINNGDLTFTERAAEYGINDEGFTTHAVFFDYDRDSDLDLYILNNSYQAIGSFNLRKNERNKRDKKGGDKLMRNDGNKFTDVSEAAGIYGSVIGFGLGVTVSDVDKDGWPDLYISNDFFERDYLYINNRNGTFREDLPNRMRSISGASMGADMADINNDTWPDLFVTEMLPADHGRIKTVTTFEDWNRYQYNVANDYFHQFTRNMLQVNNGDSTFSEIGRLSGVEATDWSWGALIFDMNNDGLRDLFVANGIYQDLTNQDFLQYASNEEFVKSVVANKSVDYKKLTEIIPSNPVPNFAFENSGNLKFTDRGTVWGLNQSGFSNGSAYGDLDNDGDLDLVVNNVNMPCFVFRNESDNKLTENRYLRFVLKGAGKNTQAIGTRITVRKGSDSWYAEQFPTRGFESSVDPRPFIGLGNTPRVDHIEVQWPDGTVTELDSVVTNQTLSLSQESGRVKEPAPASPIKKLFQARPDLISFTHQENLFVDFDRDKLLFHMISNEGPGTSAGDVNGDGLDDLYVGGAKEQPGALFIQSANGSFRSSNEKLLAEDRFSEDTRSLFFDADGDGDQDLYVCSGGSEFSSSSSALSDRLYFNDGRGTFTKSAQALPTPIYESSSVARAADYDSDGDLDLFVGVRTRAFQYGLPVNGYLLNNNGKGYFTNVTNESAPMLKEIGMITDATWIDADSDQDLDLVVVGEYMPVTLLINEKGVLKNGSESIGLGATHGWWNSIVPADLDGDGDQDLILGNHGLNSRFRADLKHPVTMYINDFDQNGTLDHILCTYYGEQSYPMVLRHDLIAQIPAVKKKFLKYEDYKTATVETIFEPEQIRNALVLKATTFASAVVYNEGIKPWVLQELPVEAQYAPVYAILPGDFNADGITDILLGGNLYRVKPEVGRYDASYGMLLTGKGNRKFEATSSTRSGILLDGEVRSFSLLQTARKSEPLLVVGRNNLPTITYSLKSSR